MSIVLYHLSPGHLARRVQQRASACFQQATAGETMSTIQFALLTAVCQFPGRDIQSLADLVALDRSTSGMVIERLELGGLVERVRNEQDRRARLVYPTREGSQRWARILPKAKLGQGLLMQALPDREQGTFVGRLEVLVNGNEQYSRTYSAVVEDRAHLSIHRSAGFLIRRLRQICDGIFFQETEGYDITPVQYATLVTLTHSLGIDNAGLGALVGLDAATLGTVVRLLHRKGLVDIGVNALDRRSKSLHVSPAGYQLIQDLHEAVTRIETRAIAPLREAEARRFIRQLIRIIDNASAPAQRRASAGAQEHRRKDQKTG